MAIFAVCLLTIFIIAASYVVLCAVIYIIEEINSEIKKAKRHMRDAIWELEWKWKMLKRRFKKHEI